MMLSLSLSFVAFVAPFQPWHPWLREKSISVQFGRTADASMMIKLAKAKPGWDDIESEMLEKLGLDGSSKELSNEQSDEQDSGGVDDVDRNTDALAAPTPRSGEQDWGRWSHESDNICVDLTLPQGVRVKDLVCDVSKLGIMRIEHQGEQILHGQLALPVDRAELTWVVEQQDDGSKLLCIELPMLPIDTSGRMKAVDCIFDDSLLINGSPCLIPGLSAPGGRS